MSTFLYSVKQGFRNFARNPLFTIASVATVGACIFLFCAFLAVVENLTQIVHTAESRVGITVFFTPEAGDSEKESILQQTAARPDVSTVRYISAEEAWADFQQEYFGEDAEELSKAFENDNPLASSDSLEVFPMTVEDQEPLATFLKGLPGVREVNYLSGFVTAMKQLNRGVYVVSLVITAVLFAVSVFLISNTIHVAAAFRKRENEIMKLIGATDFMIRAPFVVEGTLIGLCGTVIPLIAVRLLYTRAEQALAQRLMEASGVLKEMIRLIPIGEIFPKMVGSGLILGLGTGVLVSAVTISRHLRV